MRRNLRPLVAGLVVLALLLVWLQLRPVLLPMAGPEAETVFPGRETNHPILLAVDEATMRVPPARSSQVRRADLEWVNVLEQVFGGCDVRELATILRSPQELLRDRRLLVLPRGTLYGHGKELVDQLRPAVEEGLVVLLEGPGGSAASALGLQPVGLETRSHLAWPFANEGLSLDEPLRLVPSPLQMDHLVVRSRPGRIGGKPLRSVASPGGRPLVWARDEGAGGWLLHILDIGEFSLRLRQGLPDAGFRLPASAQEEPGGPGRTSRLASADDPRRAQHPWLDAWLLALLDTETLPAPWPRLWPAPAEYDGWLLASYEGRTDPEGLAQVAALTRLTEGGVTAFLPTPDAGDGVSLDPATALGIGLRWSGDRTGDLDSMPRRQGHIGPLTPWARVMSPAEQRQRLGELLHHPDVAVARSRGGHWPEDLDEGWSRVAGAGLVVDTSFGADFEEGGWLFGSGVPYRPLGPRGFVYPIREVPVHALANLGALDASALSRWLRLNSTGAQGPLHFVFSPPLADQDFEEAVSSTWMQLQSQSRRYRHKLARIEELVDFWEARARCRMTWDMRGDRLRVEFPPYEPSPTGPVAVAVPREWRGLVMMNWTASWSPASQRRARSFSRQVMLFEVPAQGGAIEVTYRAR